jgi:hypothetical protein
MIFPVWRFHIANLVLIQTFFGPILCAPNESISKFQVEFLDRNVKEFSFKPFKIRH